MAHGHICPVDGQNLDWHMKIYGHTNRGPGRGSGEPIFFGDRVGCGFISPIDRTNYTPRERQG